MTAVVVNKTDSAGGAGNSLTVNKPPNLINENLLVMVLGWWGGWTPAGLSTWQQRLITTDATSMRVAVYTHVVDGSEPASWSVTGFASANDPRMASVIQVSGDAGFDVGVSARVNDADNTWTIAGATSTVDDALLLRVCFSQTLSNTVNWAWSAGTAIADFLTPIFTSYYGHMAIRSQVQADSGPAAAVNVTRSATTGSNNFASATIAIKPSVAPPQPTVPMKPAAPTQTSVEVQWAAPTDGGSPITQYAVRIRPVGGTFVVADNLPVTSTSFNFTGLTASTTYEVGVRASNSVGNSEWSDSATVTTMAAPSPPPPPPPQPTVPAKAAPATLTPGQTSVGAQWVAPANGGSPITRYAVRIRPVGGTFVVTDNRPVTPTSFTFTGLTASTTYEVGVRASNSVGDSEWSDSALVTTQAAPPPPPPPSTVKNRPANPAAIVYEGGPLANPSAWAKPGALIIAGRGEYTQPWVATVANGGGTVIMYLDAIMRNTTGRYHGLLFNSSQFGPAVPTWPGNPTANQYGPLADFRVGSVLQNKLPGVLELIMSENPNISGIFLDDCGSRSWFPGFNWGAWSSADKEAYRAGAIRVVQTTREVVGDLFVMVNGTWGAQSSSGIGDGGYPVRSQHGISFADGGFWENHSFDSYGVGYGKSLQWGSATPRNMPFMWFSNVGDAATRTQWVNADCCAFASSTSYDGSGAPWKTTFTDFGLPRT